MGEAKKTGGLAGVTAGATALCTVGKEGAGLTYRGYDIAALVEHSNFEEVAYLLLHGKMPDRAELDAYIEKLKSLRGLPDELKTVLEMIPRDAHPMDVQRTGVSFLGNIEAEGEFSNQADTADRLLASLPSMLLYWHRFHTDGVRIDTATDDDSVAGHFLHMLHDKPPSELHRKSLDTTLILYAEHEFNASTFTGRVITGTLSDMHSAVTGAIGALRGPLHGGANEAVMHNLLEIRTPARAEKWLRDKQKNKELVMGFGHRVYKQGDSRVPTMRAALEDLAAWNGDTKWLEISDILQDIMINEKAIHPNLDFPAGPAYYLMGFDIDMYTPIFVMSRITGWAAHILEQNASNSLIRPLSAYGGRAQRKVKPISKR